ncbi:MAG: response regulator [Candidatus Moranbacteria bacterium CG_4_8_14_3_um_filter_41_13]|nr:MAG: hypothetical protein AUK58_03575 [Candidatus Moranbacteria bacterium CG2_30_41_165]PIV86328.1 MAG: response regulator [Candidatus Moranbacteria bacterium CG17_big_fil_post_rev_8_21_14_2_50_41_107]PIW94614.1 MAG: response regulator [Candidatus Moranbacteria bacterium CG_4_8_14_3_um_filter_41_13]PJC00531.1 MAG: response regulator [Candidatus Moranbacteria bacterium CG_4_9_14_0_8_um_filter_41_43]HCJ45888.1 response regulator [Candidatus Moranbacteria bacterium]
MSAKPFVLVVEDDPFYANIYRTKLAKENIDAEVVMNGDAALISARKRKPDLILSDLIMPEKDGFQTLQELKGDPSLKDIKVIILSNLSQGEDMQRVKDLGAEEYLVKANTSLQTVIEKVKNHLGIA